MPAGDRAVCVPWGPWPKSQRVRTRSQYQAVQQGGTRVVSPRFVFLLNVQGERLTHSRLGVTASRKVGGAVVRNRAKRLVREAFRATRDLWPAGIDLVVVVRNLQGNPRLCDVVREWREAGPRLSRQVERLFSRAVNTGADA